MWVCFHGYQLIVTKFSGDQGEENKAKSGLYILKGLLLHPLSPPLFSVCDACSTIAASLPAPDLCGCLPHPSHLCLTGTNRISHVIQGAHEASVFAVCMLRNGTLVSGGKDRRLISWDGSYQQIQTMEVKL